MNTLYIIGNGFDLYHGMLTQYKHFYSYVYQNNRDLWYDMGEYFTMKGEEGMFWMDFENDLATYDHEQLFDNYNNVDPADENFEREDAVGIEDDFEEITDKLVRDIKEELYRWISQVDVPERSQISSRLLRFRPNSLFLSFNYTDTLEQIYDISENQILYLHGSCKFGELIIGHCEDREHIPDDADSRTFFSDAQDVARSPLYALRKPTNDVLADNAAFFESLKDVDEVVVLGHSLGKVDWPYFERVAQNAQLARWRVSFYSSDEEKRLRTIMEAELKIANAVLEMIRIQDLQRR